MIKALFILLSLPLTLHSQVYINEIMSSNRNSIKDVDGEHSDWIELFNSGDQSINLGGYYLSDNDSDLKIWTFPNVILNSGEYLLVYASGKNKIATNGELHTNFKISKNGEPIIFSDKNGTIIDRLPPLYVETDYSLGRMPGSDEGLYIFENPTPGTKNYGNATYAREVDVWFSHKQGFHPNNFLLSINSNENVNIVFTTDSSLPDLYDGELYSQAIPINNRVGHKNIYSEIPSAEEKYWRTPKSEIPKIWNIRAVPMENNIPIGREIQGSFWVNHHNPEQVSLPIISVITDPDNLFDYYNGIYVPGVMYDSVNRGNFFLRGRETEKEAYFSFFCESGSLKLSQNIGLRVHGNTTRAFRQKSLRLYARRSYGEEYFQYQFFQNRSNDNYKRLLLSTVMGDRSGTLFKDEFCTYFARELDLDYLEYKPVLVFLNGEYWGIHFLRERRDTHFIAQNHNIENRLNIDRLYNNVKVVEGSNSNYLQMLNYISTNNIEEPQIYENVKKMMDVNNFIDYKCLQIFFNNTDWPHNNIEFWRHDTIGGKWRWILFDLDQSTRDYSKDNISAYFNSNVKNEIESNKQFAYDLLGMLMQNPEFKNRFINRFIFLLDNVLSTENLINTINDFNSTLKPYVPEHINRWDYPPSVYDWQQNIETLNRFALFRPPVIYSLLKENRLNPYIISPNPVEDYIKINFICDIEDNYNIKVYNALGQQIDLSNRINMNSQATEVNFSGLNPGFYIVMIIINNNVYSDKIIKI